MGSQSGLIDKKLASERSQPPQATPLQKKEASRLFLADHMATLLQEGESYMGT